MTAVTLPHLSPSFSEFHVEPRSCVYLKSTNLQTCIKCAHSGYVFKNLLDCVTPAKQSSCSCDLMRWAAAFSLSQRGEKIIRCNSVFIQPRQSIINSLVAILSCPILYWPQATGTERKPGEMNRDRQKMKTRTRNTKHDFPVFCFSLVAAEGNEERATDEA